MKRTFVYVDGFNLYFRALKNTPYKWLDLKTLCRKLLAEDHKITSIKYFTANISGRNDPNGPIRQQTYIRALQKYIPELSVHYGKFITHNVWARLSTARQAQYRKDGELVRVSLKDTLPENAAAEIVKTEEKGSDVNLAVHLLNDAWSDCFDAAFVISNDSDLAESVSMVRGQLKKIVGVGIPEGRHTNPSKELISRATFRKRIRKGMLAVSQLPNPIPGTTLHKPDSW